VPKVSEMMKKGKYLKTEDLNDIGGEATVTVVGVKEMNVALENQPEQMKWVMKVQELDQLVILNNTNLQLMEKATGSDDSSQWRGKQIVIYVDESVSFGGKLVGGIRVRRVPAAVAEATPAVAPKQTAKAGDKFDDFEDDIPFELGT
jgi:predicted phosphoribosyltransferase